MPILTYHIAEQGRTAWNGCYHARRRNRERLALAGLLCIGAFGCYQLGQSAACLVNWIWTLAH